MNKQEELKALKGFITSLPAETYLRGALIDWYGWIANEMAGDMIPDLVGRSKHLEKQNEGLQEETGRQKQQIDAAGKTLFELQARIRENQNRLDAIRGKAENILRDCK